MLVIKRSGATRAERFPRGYTIVEVLVYVALVVVVTVALSSLVSQLIRVHTQAQVTQESLTNARAAVDAILQEVRHAESIYTPTSCFDSDTTACAGVAAPTFGQLSLRTSRDAPTGHTKTYVDYYADNGRLYVKREGVDAELITAPRTVVQSVVFRHLNSDGWAPAIRVEVTIGHETTIPGIGAQPSVTLYGTATIRSSF